MSEFRERLDEERYDLMEREEFDVSSAWDAEMRLNARDELEGKTISVGKPARP